MIEIQSDIDNSHVLKYIIERLKKLKTIIRIYHIIIIIVLAILIIFPFVYRSIWIKGMEKHVNKDITGVPLFLLPKEDEIIAEYYSSGGYYLRVISDGRVFIEKNKKSLGLLYITDDKEELVWKYAESITYLGKYSYEVSCQLNEDTNHFNDYGYNSYVFELNPPRPMAEGIQAPPVAPPLEGEDSSFSYCFKSRYREYQGGNMIVYTHDGQWPGIEYMSYNPYCQDAWKITRNSWFFERFSEYIANDGKQGDSGN